MDDDLHQIWNCSNHSEDVLKLVRFFSCLIMNLLCNGQLFTFEHKLLCDGQWLTALLLVWGLLRLAPINIKQHNNTVKHDYCYQILLNWMKKDNAWSSSVQTNEVHCATLILSKHANTRIQSFKLFDVVYHPVSFTSAHKPKTGGQFPKKESTTVDNLHMSLI